MKHTLKIELENLQELLDLIFMVESFKPADAGEDHCQTAWIKELNDRYEELNEIEENQEPSDGEAWSGGFSENH